MGEAKGSYAGSMRTLCCAGAGSGDVNLKVPYVVVGTGGGACSFRDRGFNPFVFKSGTVSSSETFAASRYFEIASRFIVICNSKLHLI